MKQKYNENCQSTSFGTGLCGENLIDLQEVSLVTSLKPTAWLMENYTGTYIISSLNRFMTHKTYFYSDVTSYSELTTYTVAVLTVTLQQMQY